MTKLKGSIVQWLPDFDTILRTIKVSGESTYSLFPTLTEQKFVSQLVLNPYNLTLSLYFSGSTSFYATIEVPINPYGKKSTVVLHQKLKECLPILRAKDHSHRRIWL